MECRSASGSEPGCHRASDSALQSGSVRDSESEPVLESPALVERAAPALSSDSASLPVWLSSCVSYFRDASSLISLAPLR